jgi:type IV pilus assembly protein PilY1
MGGIMHSAPVIIVQNSRTSESESRTEIAYVGDLYGMLHAIDIATGMEKWAFIPPNLLELLQNDRTDPNAVQNFAAVDGSPTARDVFYDHDNNPDTAKQWRTILVCAEGLGGKYIFALDVTDPNNFSLLWEITDNDMGHGYRTAIGKVKSGEELKWMVFMATGNASIVAEHGGINIFAFDLISGAEVWHFSNDYSDAVNDIPGSITLFDTDDDTFVDRVYVGDMNGRMWALEALTGTNPYGTVQSGDDMGKQIPLWNAGVGNPISVSPAIVRVNPVILVFGTGGTDWAATGQHYYVYAVTTQERDDPENPPSYAGGAGTLYWDQQFELPLGEKVWSTPTIAAFNIYLATAIGTMESGSPRNDLASAGQDTGTFYSISLEDGSQNWSINNIGKVRGSVFVDKQHAYLTTIGNEIIQIGGDTFPPDAVINVVLRAWRQL